MRNVSMTDAEAEEFLNEHSQLYLASVSENEWPHVTPVAYATLNGMENLYILTHPEQRKSQNIFHNNRVGIVVDEGDSYSALKGVFMHGYATIVRDPAHIDTLEQAWVDQCYGGELPDIVQSVYSRRDSWVWFEIEPVNTVTWDNSNVDSDRLIDDNPPSGLPFQYDLPEDAGAAEGPRNTTET